MRNLLILSAMLLLTACDHWSEDRDAVLTQTQSDAEQMIQNVEERDVNAATRVRDQVRVTGEKFRTWLITPPPPKPGPHAIAASYCYKSLQDIACYHQPVPGWEHRLVAYQGTGAIPPLPATMETLPKRVQDDSLLPENKVAASKPVFTSIPVPPKEEEKNSDALPVLDATHEQLPNPAALPQL